MLQPEAEKAGVTYAQIMGEARKGINLTDIEIGSVRYRQAVTGAQMLEVAGEGNAAKADKLAERLREILAETGIKVAKPAAQPEEAMEIEA